MHPSLEQLTKRRQRIGSVRHAGVQVPFRTIELIRGVTAIVRLLPFPSFLSKAALFIHVLECEECALDGGSCGTEVSKRALNFNETLRKWVNVPQGDIVVWTIRSYLAGMAARLKLIAGPGQELVVLRERWQEHKRRSARSRVCEVSSRGTIGPPEEQRQPHRDDRTDGLHPCSRSLVRIYPLEHFVHA